MKTIKYISAILLLLLSISCSTDLDNKYESPEIPNQFTNFTIDNDTQSIDNEITVTIQSGDYQSTSVRFVDEIGVLYTPPKTEPSEGENAGDLDNVFIPTITATENNNLEYKISATKLRLDEKALLDLESFLVEVKVVNNSGVELTGYDRIYFSDVEYIFNTKISFNETGGNSQIFNVGIEDTDDLDTNIITVGGTGIVAENNGFIGVATADPSDDGATAVFTFDLTTNAATAIDATLNLELAKRAKGSVTGTVSVTGYPDTPFSYEATSTVDGGSAPAIDFEFASTISLVSGTTLTVTITLDQMLTEGNTTAPIFRLSKVIINKDGNAPEPTKDTWLDVDNSIENLTISTVCTDCSVAIVANPDAADAEATNVTKWTIGSTSGSGNKSLDFDFKDGEGITLADYANLIVTVRMYWPSYSDISNYDSNERIRFYLSDGVNEQQVQGNFVESNEAGWHTMEFDFTGTPAGGALTSDIISGEIRLIGNKFTNIDNGLEFYIDTITSNL
ncbi:hypothetical protein ACFFU1_15080 [Algibacter miyuki]|uniref:Calx-beta domain-containing protein n=1 Tax=Algibacter miyuki TaxID=1306933 RepID=A0ABV5H422_9FLAO|nr:hypothetical protein [Algibacter miyuki]MDN3663912.1 hypothetical protein [Algibacter miyuki]